MTTEDKEFEFQSKRDESYSTESTEKMAKKAKIKNVYKCCGTDIDRRVLQIILQIVVILTTLVFSMFMVSKSDGADGTVWISIISALVGNHMPNYMHRDTQQENV